MNDPPLIIGHRGASALAPENTIAAFANALRDGADGVEFDVRLSSDGVPIVIHDATLGRTATINTAVSALTSAELCEVEVGSWFNRKFPGLARPEYDRERLPSVAQVFDLFSDTSGILYLEMKCNGLGCEALARQVVELIKTSSLVERTIVECFHLPAIAEIKQLDPMIRTAALFQPSIKRPLSLLKRMAMVDMARDYGADEIALHYTLATKRVVEKAARLNLPCVVWTVDDPRWVRRGTSLGLKALITNNPRPMLRGLLKD